MEGIEYRESAAILDETPATRTSTRSWRSPDLVEVGHALHQVVNVKGD